MSYVEWITPYTAHIIYDPRVRKKNQTTRSGKLALDKVILSPIVHSGNH